MSNEEKADRELIQIIRYKPHSNEADEAKTILDYRQYQETKRLNVALIWLTVVIAFAAICGAGLQVWSTKQKVQVEIVQPPPAPNPAGN